MRKSLISFFIFGGLIFSFFLIRKTIIEKSTLSTNQFLAEVIENKKIENEKVIETKEIEEKEEKIKIEEIKSEVNLNVPFTSQAPDTKWDDLHNNACEEASIIMVDYYLKEKSLTKEKAEEEILKLVDYQIKNYKEHKDLKAEEVVKLIKDYYGYKKVRVKYNITIEKIKEEISKGNPVILPMAGRLLKNPYYRRPGPLYHMLVAKGYKDKKIITNDPGTKRGKDFIYDEKIFYQAIHNWNEEDILKGEKVGVIIEK